MDVLTNAKKLLDLIKSIHGAWATLAILFGLVVASAGTVPLSVWLAAGAMLLLSIAFGIYKLRRHLLFTPFHEAAQNAYETLQGTLWATAADRMHDQPSPQNSLQYMGQLLINDGKLDLYGVRPPSRVFQRIDAKTMQHAVVEDECKKLVPADRKELPWVALMVKRAALKERVRSMKGEMQFPWPTNTPHEMAEEIATALRVPDQSLYRKVLKEIVSGNGTLDIVFDFDGISYVVRNKQRLGRRLNNGQDQRELADIHEAVEILIEYGWLRLDSQAKDDKFYKVTGSGYKEAERVVWQRPGRVGQDME